MVGLPFHSAIPFSILSRRAKTQQVLLLEIKHEDGSTAILSGTIDEILANGLIIETKESVRYVPSDRILSWEIRKDETSSTQLDEQPQQNSDSDKNLELDDVALRKPTAGSYSSNNYELSGSPNLELVFAGEPILQHPDPSFDTPSLDKNTREIIDRWRNRFNYAMKVREPARIVQDIPDIAELAESLGSPDLFYLAGTLSRVCNLGSGKAEEYFERALEYQHQPAAFALSALLIEQGTWSKAAKYIYLTLKIKGNIDKTSLIRTLGQCIPRISTREIPPIGNLLLSSDLEGKARELLNNLIAIVCSNDTNAYRFALNEDIEMLKSSEYSQILFSDEDEQITPQRGKRSREEVNKERRGRISAYYPARNFGFIVEALAGQTWFFHKSEVESEKLLSELIDGKLVRREIIFSGTVEGALNGKYPLARGIMLWSEEQSTGDDMPQRAPLRIRLASIPKDNSSFAKAKEYEQLDQLEKAKTAYKEEIRKNGKHCKSAVKDLASLINREGEPEKAIELLSDYLYLFDEHERLSIDHLKAQFLVKARRYLESAELLRKIGGNLQAKRKRVAYFRQEAYCFLAAGEFDKSIELLNDLLQLDPNDSATFLLLEKAKESKQSGLVPIDVSSGMDDDDNYDELASRAEGLSSLARWQLENCDLRGIDARVKESREFKNTDFTQVEKLYERTKGRRPRERSEYLLTLASLCELSPEAAGRRSKHSFLRRHFSALAEAFLAEGTDLDVVRCFASESLALCPGNPNKEKDLHQIEAAWILLLGSYYSVRPEPASLLEPEPGQRLTHILKYFESDQTGWDSFMKDAPFYRMRASSSFQLLDEACKNLDFLCTVPVSTSEESKRVRDDELAFRALSFDPISADKLRKMKESLRQRVPHARFELDRSRMIKFAELLADGSEYALDRYFRDRETRFLRLKGEISRCIDDWQKLPTHVSMEWLSPKLINFLDILRADFAGSESLVPRVELRNVLDNDFYIVNEKIISLKLLLTSCEESAPPIEAITLLLESGENDDPCHSPEPLHGGESREVELTYKPTSKQIDDGVFTVSVIIECRTRKGKIEKLDPFPIAIRLGSLDMIQGAVDCSTLAGLCEVVYMQPLDQDGLCQLAIRSTIPPQDIAIDTLWEITGGHPFLSEVIMCEALENFQESITRDLIFSAQSSQAHEFTNQYRQLQNLLSQDGMFDILCQITVGPRWQQTFDNHSISLLKHYGILRYSDSSSQEITCMSNHFREYLISISRTTPSWYLLGEAERQLRYLVSDRMEGAYGINWFDKIREKFPKLQEALDKLGEQKDREQRIFGESASDFILDYAYIGNLKDIIFAEWDVFRSLLGGKKGEWEARFQSVTKVRNPMAHHRPIPSDSLYEAEQTCKVILERIRGNWF